MSELVDFLRARLDEDATEIAKHPGGEDDWEFVATGESNYPCTPYLMIGKKRALAEVEAKRRIVDQYERAHENRRAHPGDLASAGAVLTLLGTLGLLASVYADHADYRAEWAA